MHKFPQLGNLCIDCNGYSMINSFITPEILVRFVSYVMGISKGHVAGPCVLIPAMMIFAFVKYFEGKTPENRMISTASCHEFRIVQRITADSQLQYINLIENVGKFMDKLSICVPDKNSHNNRDMYNMLYGYYLDYIFLHCPKLTHIYLDLSTINRCNPILFQSKSIQSLTLTCCKIGKNGLSELSARLPSLRHMTISNCQIESPQGKDGIHINMEYTVFDMSKLDISFTTRYLLKLTTEQGDKYYDLNRSSYTLTQRPDKYEGGKIYFQFKSITKLCLRISYYKEMAINYAERESRFYYD